MLCSVLVCHVPQVSRIQQILSPGPPFVKVAPICTKSAVPMVPAGAILSSRPNHLNLSAHLLCQSAEYVDSVLAPCVSALLDGRLNGHVPSASGEPDHQNELRYRSSRHLKAPCYSGVIHVSKDGDLSWGYCVPYLGEEKEGVWRSSSSFISSTIELNTGIDWAA